MTQPPPETSPESSPETSPAVARCPSCGEPAPADSNFCEACGAPISTSAPAVGAAVTTLAPAAEEAGPIEAGTSALSMALRASDPAAVVPAAAAGTRACLSCDGVVGPDGYCETCGTKAPSERDHFREQPAAWVAGVCDRGIAHHRNEDAMALHATGDPAAPERRAVLLVLDGVSNTDDSSVGSLAGARAAAQVLSAPLPRGMGTAGSRLGAVTHLLAEAARSANVAVVAATTPGTERPASATFTLAVLEGDTVWHANIGDSRTYWLPDDGPGVQLSVDDSAAQLQIAAGVPRAEAESSPQAHAITKWLGSDSPSIEPVVGTLELTGPGWLLACSDGLWNYASTPEELRARIDAAVPPAVPADPAAVALELVRFANASGGQDNITAALARVDAIVATPAVPPAPPAPPAPGEADG